MRTTVTLDDDVYEAVIQISALSGERPGKILSRLVRKGLNPEPAAHLRTGRFPQFSVPADAPLIPASHVQQLLDDEGIV